NSATTAVSGWDVAAVSTGVETVSSTDETSPSTSRMAMASPILAIPSTLIKISFNFPATGEGTSESTLSVAISTTDSSSAILSPTFFNQLMTVASITPSPIAGNINL